MFIQFGTRITHVRILSAGRDHCFLLTLEGGDPVAVKSGFASGYGGEGPSCFSYVLQILDSHGAEIIEHDVAHSLLDKIDYSALTKSDLERVENMSPVCPTRWHDYVFHDDFKRASEGTLWREQFPAVMPFALIDARIMNLALDFWNSPDNSLLVGYRRLEDIVRQRTTIKQHGTKLFSQAFSPGDGVLTWEQVDDGERVGRMQLFTGTYTAHRNRRAHRELQTHSKELLSEFLLLNHLYCLERDAVERDKV
ncbi:MAG: TIGR02391 family protein [Candidatus Sulfotelmatobacter sp.]